MEKTFSPTCWSPELGKPNCDGDHDRYQWLLDSISILSQKSGNATKRWGQWGIITQRIVRAVKCKWLWAWSSRRKATAMRCWFFMSRIMTLRVLSPTCCFRWNLWPWAMICSEKAIKSQKQIWNQYWKVDESTTVSDAVYKIWVHNIAPVGCKCFYTCSIGFTTSAHQDGLLLRLWKKPLPISNSTAE